MGVLPAAAGDIDDAVDAPFLCPVDCKRDCDLDGGGMSNISLARNDDDDDSD